MEVSRAAYAIWPLVACAAAIFALRSYFAETWRELDEDAAREPPGAKQRSAARTMVGLVTAAVAITLQQYSGGVAVYDEVLRPLLAGAASSRPWLRLDQLGELYAAGWWVATRVVAFVLLPVAVNRVCASRGLGASLGAGGRELARHGRLTAAVVAAGLPLIWLASRDPGLARVYPNYEQAGRSVVELVAWEALYVTQFLALEVFLRGWLLNMLRGLGSASIFVMTVPYCMMHFAGKPYAETILSIAAGVALGSVAVRTRSIWHGFVMHAALAVAMDAFALAHRGEIPHSLFPP